jgi:hypothetical protein
MIRTRDRARVGTRLGRAILGATAVQCLMGASSASAFLLPLRAMDDSWFPGSTAGVEVTALRMDVSPALEARNTGNPDAWSWDLELRLHCIAIEAQVVPLAVVSTGVDSTAEVWIDGRPANASIVPVRRDPALPEMIFDDGALVQLACNPGDFVTIRIRVLAEARVDSYGQHFLDAPLHTLGQFAGTIDTVWLNIQLRERPMALQSTITNPVWYEEPHPSLSWYMRSWEPSIPFQMSWLSPWTTLQMVTGVESCPDPWQVVQQMSAGNVGAIRSYLAGFDEGTLSFCGMLPSVIHGAPFSSGASRAQLEAISMRRYLPTLAHDVPLYRENPAWNESMLSDVERMYARALQDAMP